MHRRPFIVIALAIVLGAAAAIAQQDMSKVEIKSQSVGPHLTMLQGAGGNIGVFAGDDGVVLIDDQFAPLSDKIKAAVAKISDKPIRFVLNTHWHGDHTGGNQNFAAGGATIIAQDRVTARMTATYTNPVFGWTSQPSPAQALPVLSFNDSLSFHLNGEDVVCFHVANAHTDGDVVVWFPKENVIHGGDVVFNGMYPIIDVGSGGTVAGMLAGQAKILAIANDSTKIIAGHGPLASKNDLGAAHQMLERVHDRVAKLLAQKMTLDQITAAKPLADLDLQWGKSFVSADIMLKEAVLDMQRR